MSREEQSSISPIYSHNFQWDEKEFPNPNPVFQWSLSFLLEPAADQAAFKALVLIIK